MENMKTEFYASRTIIIRFPYACEHALHSYSIIRIDFSVLLFLHCCVQAEIIYSSLNETRRRHF